MCMVLESIINPSKAEKEPWELFFIGILYSSIAIFFGLFVFGDTDVSMVIVFLTVLACSVLMYRTLRFEEEKDRKVKKEWSLLKEHGRALRFFIFLFMGFVVSFTLWYVFLPWEISEKIFSTQIGIIASVNTVFTGMAVIESYFWVILLNNIKVLLFSLFFSFFYGMGAIFILTWNASVIATATGLFITKSISAIVEHTGTITILQYLTAISFGFLRYLIHGIPEITAYFIGGLAGGILSVAVINHINNHELFKRVVKDAGILTCFALGLLIIAALLEVWVTPLLFI